MNDHLDQKFVKNWTLNTFYGWLIGFAFILVLAGAFESVGISSQFFIGTGMGAGVGWMQWRVGRKYFELGQGWMWASVAGMTIGFLMFDYGPEIEVTETFRLPAKVMDGALLTAVFQAFIIRKMGPKAWWWFFICLAAWTTPPLLIFLSDKSALLFGRNMATGFLTLLMIVGGGLTLGWVGGKGLRRIL